jgi:hypothetical protein
VKRQPTGVTKWSKSKELAPLFLRGVPIEVDGWANEQPPNYVWRFVFFSSEKGVTKWSNTKKKKIKVATPNEG